VGGIKLAENISNIIKKLVPDKDLREALSAKIETKVLSVQDNLIDARVRVMLAEMISKSWMARNWRPGFMWVFLFVIANNMLLAPYLNLVFGVNIAVEIPERMWRFMEITSAVYIGARTFEKTKKEKNGEAV